MAASKKVHSKASHPTSGVGSSIHIAGGANSSATMVMVFTRSFVLFVQSHNLRLVSQGLCNVVTFCPTLSCIIPYVFELSRGYHKLIQQVMKFSLLVDKKKNWSCFVNKFVCIIFFAGTESCKKIMHELSLSRELHLQIT
jgi:hypothetical protein